MGEQLLDLTHFPPIPELHTLVGGGGLSCITIARPPSLEGGASSPSNTMKRLNQDWHHAWSRAGRDALEASQRPASARTTQTRRDAIGADLRARPVSAKSRLQQSAPRNTAPHQSPAAARSPGRVGSRSPPRASPRTSSSPRSPRTASPRTSGESCSQGGGGLEVFSGNVAPSPGGQAVADAQPWEARGGAADGAAVPALDLERMRLSPPGETRGGQPSSARPTSAKARGLALSHLNRAPQTES